MKMNFENDLNKMGCVFTGDMGRIFYIKHARMLRVQLLFMQNI